MVELAQLRENVRDGRKPAVRHLLPKHIEYYMRSLEEMQSPRALSLVALPHSLRRFKSPLDWTRIIAIAKFRTPFTVIEELSKALAPAVGEMGIVPMIVPLTERTLLTMNWQTPVIRAMTSNGFFIFDQGGNS